MLTTLHTISMQVGYMFLKRFLSSFIATLISEPGPVSNLRFKEVVDTSIVVNWAPPRFRNGIISGYTLSYFERDVTNPKVNSFNLKPGVMTKRITDLKHQTWYIVTVVAKTNIGDGVPR